MTRRVYLPVSERIMSSLATPSVDAIRKRLGGRSSTEPSAGNVVRLVASGRLGVVVHERDHMVDVYTDNGIVRRTPADEVVPGGAAGPELDGIAADARVHGTLAEGQRVRYQTSASEMGEGRLVEKCRYGSLVERDDGVIIGVGFRRLWPAIGSNQASS